MYDNEPQDCYDCATHHTTISLQRMHSLFEYKEAVTNHTCMYTSQYISLHIWMSLRMHSGVLSEKSLQFSLNFWY